VIPSRHSWCAAGSGAGAGLRFAAQLPPPEKERARMSDVIFVAASIVFFAVAIWYGAGCERLMKGGRNDG
jgi:hypothetical protein